MCLAPVVKLRWDGPGVFTPDPDVTVSVETADSWLVDEGRTRGLDRHRHRFVASCPPTEPAAAFFDDALATLPRTGRWFPRLEFHHGRFRVWIRPAPPQTSTIVLWTPDAPDPRLNPTVKGPDLATLLALRARAAAEAGASEAVLLSPDGWVREGALSALMWWREDVLCTPPEGPELLPSVTRALVLQIAADLGQAVRFERVRPSELAALECWSLSALHGIRVAQGPDQRIGERAQRWQARLLNLARPLPPKPSRP